MSSPLTAAGQGFPLVGTRPSRPASEALPASIDRVDLGSRRDDPPPTPTPPPPPAPPPPPPFNPQPGADGIGDPYYPKWGNGGYHAKHYTIDIAADVEKNQLAGTTTMEAQATQDLSSFDMDLKGMDVAKITVNGQDATFQRQDDKLIVTPAAALHNGDDFSVAVKYSGTPQPTDSVAVPMTVGWRPYDGGIDVDSEPEGSRTWFPCNDHPRDKASYTFKIEVPKNYTVAANGLLQEKIENDKTNTWIFNEQDPMASYLATVQIGNFVEQDDKSPNGVAIRNYFPPNLADAGKADTARVGEMIDYFGSLFGPYPFPVYGNFVLPQSMVGGALECQTMSVFDPDFVTGDRSNETVFAHELTHQWWGDEATGYNWQDIWLHEGFASYGEWLWREHTDGPDAVKQRAHDVHDWLKSQDGRGPHAEEKPKAVQELLKAHPHGKKPGTEAFGGIKIGQPPPNDVFDYEVYIKGALSLYALRATVGDKPFFDGMKSYISKYAGGNATIDNFRAELEKTSGQDLKAFFDAWLYSTTIPDLPAGA